MSKAAPPPELPYYYAGGERVTLEPDPAHVALQLNAAGAADAATRSRSRGAPERIEKRRAALGPQARDLGAGVVLLDAAARCAADDADDADDATTEARLPVFRSGSTLLVALPEVRVEDDDPQAMARLQAWLREGPGRAEVVESRPGRLTLRAGPTLAHDGVALAREVVERCGVASASPRLLRVTPAPKR